MICYAIANINSDLQNTHDKGPQNKGTGLLVPVGLRNNNSEITVRLATTIKHAGLVPVRLPVRQESYNSADVTNH